jgi:FAD synthase
MDLWFYHYERPEKKFDSVESLAEQLRMDKENGKVFWREEHDL